MKRPSFQFYPGDWQRDTALRLCSIGARGCWLEMLCIMHQATPYGHLVHEGRALQAKQIASLIGGEATAKQVQAWLDEMEAEGVFARTEDGCIYSRRMVRDESVRQARAEGGKSGAEHGIKGAAHGKKGGRPRKETGDKKPPLEPPLGGGGNPPLEPPPSSSSSSSYSVPTGVGTGTDVPPATPVPAEPPNADAPPGLEPQEAIFQIAVPWLVTRGMPDRSARSLLGGAVKQLGAQEAWELASECIRQGVLEPAAWLSKSLNERIATRAGPGGGRRKGSRADERAAWNAELSEVLAEGGQRTEKDMGVIDVSDC